MKLKTNTKWREDCQRGLPFLEPLLTEHKHSSLSSDTSRPHSSETERVSLFAYNMHDSCASVEYLFKTKTIQFDFQASHLPVTMNPLHKKESFLVLFSLSSWHTFLPQIWLAIAMSKSKEQLAWFICMTLTRQSCWRPIILRAIADFSEVGTSFSLFF